MKTTKKLLLAALMLAVFNPAFSQTESQKASKSIDFAKLDKLIEWTLYYKNGDVKKLMSYYENPIELSRVKGKVYEHHTEKGVSDYSLTTLDQQVNNDDLEAFEIDGHKWKRITYDGKEVFGIVHIEGAIRYFSLFDVPAVRKPGDYQENEYLQKLDQEPITGAKLLFKYSKTIQELVKDNTELSAKVAAGEEGYKGILNMSKVIEEYNTWYASQNPSSK